MTAARLELLQTLSQSSVDVLTESPCSANPDAVTAQTIARMSALVGQSHASRAVADAARLIASTLPAGADRRRICDAVWTFARHRVRFVLDEQLLPELGKPDASELLLAPWVLLAMDDPRGDCDDFSTLLCSLLCQFGVPCEFVTIAGDPQDKNRFSHVYVYARLEDGSKYALDASHGPAPGWEAPRVYRRATWPILSAPPSEASRRAPR